MTSFQNQKWTSTYLNPLPSVFPHTFPPRTDDYGDDKASWFGTSSCMHAFCQKRERASSCVIKVPFPPTAIMPPPPFPLLLPDYASSNWQQAKQQAGISNRHFLHHTRGRNWKKKTVGSPFTFFSKKIWFSLPRFWDEPKVLFFFLFLPGGSFAEPPTDLIFWMVVGGESFLPKRPHFSPSYLFLPSLPCLPTFFYVSGGK